MKISIFGNKVTESRNIAVIAIGVLVIVVLAAVARSKDEKMPAKNNQTYNQLTPEEERVIVNKGTELPFTGTYATNKAKGFYTCKRCDAPLYMSDNKFDSGCGWPSFDDGIEGAVKRIPDPDGQRTEIVCANCGAHLGHVFVGEGLTRKNIRHCVNSISMNFIPIEKTERAIFAGGCFWGVEYHFHKVRGVLQTTVGYTGGHSSNPTYEQVCSGTTGHREALEVVYNPALVSYEQLARLFFEIHDPTQVNGQGPDIGEQYQSEIFYVNDQQKEIAQKLIDILKLKGDKVVTRLVQAGTFWKAEDYHQDYYEKKHGSPYCHVYTKRF